MARTFSIDTSASPSLLLARARKVASENSVSLVGNESSGRFSHKMLKGEYRRIGRTVIVTITYKYRLVPWSVLEGRLRGLFGGASPGMPPVREVSTTGTARRTRGRRRANRRHPHQRRHPHLGELLSPGMVRLPPTPIGPGFNRTSPRQRSREEVASTYSTGEGTLFIRRVRGR
jgi:hypothetical protein